MTPDRWQTIKEIFNAAVLLQPEERAGFLADACGDDEAVRSEVASLLSAHAGDEGFLAVPAFAMGAELLMDLSGGPSAGDQIGPYKILSELGSGGMGDVFLALDTRLGRNVALKLLPVELARDLQRVRRFELEARTASALNHPNVCVIHEIGKTSDGRQFIAMEYIDGVTLRTRLGQKPMTLTETLDVGAQVAWALEAAHAAGVVHRDIKPENIMLRRDGYVKVLDFGIAKLNENISQPSALTEASTLGKVHTDPGTRMGTVKYMSPEQLRERPVDERTDIWSLGVVLHEMATGATPFAARTTNETIAAILERQPVSFTAGGENIPTGFRQIIKKALSKNRRDRYQKVSSLAADLRQLRRQIEDGTAGKFREPETPSELNAKDSPTRPIDDSRDRAGPRKGKTLFSTTGEFILAEIKGHKKAAVLVAIAGIVAVLFAGTYLLRQVNRREESKPTGNAALAMWETAKPRTVRNTGTSVCAAISPDGKYVVHAEKRGGMQELKSTGLVNNQHSVVVEAAEVEYRGITFSPDGTYVYVVSNAKNEAPSLYQIAWPSSEPRKVKDGVDSPIAFSPDGDRFTFVRINRAISEYALVVADRNGGQEKIIATRRNGETFSEYGPAWSPDGKTIVCGAGYWDTGHHGILIEANLETLDQKVLGAHQWFSILQIAWRAESGGLIVSAADGDVRPYQLWLVSYPGGDVKQITNGPGEYKGVSLPNGANKIISIQSQWIAEIWVTAKGEATKIASPVSFAFGLSWTREGSVVFSSMVGNELDLTLVDQSGTHQRQLTVHEGDNYTPTVCADGRFIVFASNRRGGLNIWRMNAADGSDPTQLTFTDGNSYPSCSPDGKWVVYDNQSKGAFTVWKVPIDGGTPEKLSEKNARMPVVSPDGAFIACRYIFPDRKREIAILPFSGGDPVRRVPIPMPEWQSVQWWDEGRALTYVEKRDGRSNIWSYDLASGAKKQLTHFEDEQIFAYGWSPDQRFLASERGTEIRGVMIIENQ